MGLGEDFLQHGRVLDVVAGRLGLGGAEAQHGVTSRRRIKHSC